MLVGRVRHPVGGEGRRCATRVARGRPRRQWRYEVSDSPEAVMVYHWSLRRVWALCVVCIVRYILWSPTERISRKSPPVFVTGMRVLALMIIRTCGHLLLQLVEVGSVWVLYAGY